MNQTENVAPMEDIVEEVKENKHAMQEEGGEGLDLGLDFEEQKFYLSIQGKKVELSKCAWCLSPLLKASLEDMDQENEDEVVFDIKPVKSLHCDYEALKEVARWMEDACKRKELKSEVFPIPLNSNVLEEMLETDFDKKFVEGKGTEKEDAKVKKERRLFEYVKIMNAANFLGLDYLTRMMALAVTHCICGKSPASVARMFDGAGVPRLEEFDINELEDVPPDSDDEEEDSDEESEEEDEKKDE